MLFFSFLLLVPTSSYGQKRYKVVLDAGHGGKDPGNLGSGFKEKYIALKVVQAVARELRNLNDIEVVLTRDKDVFIELHNRAKIANDKKADLFVSIHCDAFHRSDPHGAGTFVLGLRGNKGNLEIAKRENAVILLEDDYKQNYDYDPNSPESVIGLSVLQEENLDESLALAGLIQNKFVEVKRFDRSVKQDNFLVLRETVMPSVLVELGFLTNKAEGKFLNSKSGQIKMAKSIAKAIEKYIQNLKLNTVREAVQEVVKEDPIVKKEPEKSKEEIVKTKEEPVKKENIDTSTVVPSARETPKTFTIPHLEFKVQVAASRKHISTEAYNFKGLQNIEMKIIGEYYKYYYGSSSDIKGLKQALKEVKQAGHQGAFVVAFQDGVKIPLKQALKKQ